MFEMKAVILSGVLLAGPAFAAGDEAASQAEWTGAGEFGLAIARGNARSENINARLGFNFEDSIWKHSWYLTELRAKGEVVVDPDGKIGSLPAYESYQLTANRFEAGASSGYKFGPRIYAFGALRYENDDFSPYHYQATLAGGIGYYFIDDRRTTLFGEFGPGYRYARALNDKNAKGRVIARGLLDFKTRITDSTEIFDRFLVESGADNTFIQNDVGVSVAMNERFAIKAALQYRHNTDVPVGVEKTDSLTMLNLVYNVK